MGIQKNSEMGMLGESLLQFALDNAIEAVAKSLKEKKGVLNNAVKDIHFSINEHLQIVDKWSSQISFKDIKDVKVTARVFVDVDIFLMPRKLKLSDSEEVDRFTSKNYFDFVKGHSVVLGQPGAGKTTLMKYLCYSIIHNESFFPNFVSFPLLIRLREIGVKTEEKNEKKPLINYLFDLLGLVVYSKNENIKDDGLILIKERILISFLETLKPLILLDGFDEIPNISFKDKVLEDFRGLCESLSACKLVLTSRSSDYDYHIESAQVLEICPLSESQIQEFANKWLGDVSNANKFISQLNSSPFADTAIRPLTISHLCAIYERFGKIPDKPKTVYRKIVNLLLEDWDVQRSVKRVSRYGNFEVDRKFEFLCRLAYEITLKHSRSLFTKQELRSIYLKLCSDFDLDPSDVTIVINELEAHTGLLVQSGFADFEFAHKSLHEYLAAEHLVKLPTIPTKARDIFKLSNEFAIAVSISSNSSLYFTELVFERLIEFDSPEQFIINFINRIVLEKPDFNNSEEVGIALLILYTMFRKGKDGQLRIFEFESYLPAQFEKFVALALKRSSKKIVLHYYTIEDKFDFDSNDCILSLVRNEKVLDDFRYDLPKYLFTRQSFLKD